MTRWNDPHYEGSPFEGRADWRMLLLWEAALVLYALLAWRLCA